MAAPGIADISLNHIRKPRFLSWRWEYDGHQAERRHGCSYMCTPTRLRQKARSDLLVCGTNPICSSRMLPAWWLHNSMEIRAKQARILVIESIPTIRYLEARMNRSL
jgi:hypothetical protein